MTDCNTVEIAGTNPSTSITIVIDDAVLSETQREVIEGILRQTEQQVLRYLGQTPSYPANAVAEDRTWGYS